MFVNFKATFNSFLLVFMRLVILTKTPLFLESRGRIHVRSQVSIWDFSQIFLRFETFCSAGIHKRSWAKTFLRFGLKSKTA